MVTVVYKLPVIIGLPLNIPVSRSRVRPTGSGLPLTVILRGENRR
jgi:hypothetical protein